MAIEVRATKSEKTKKINPVVILNSEAKRLNRRKNSGDKNIRLNCAKTASALKIMKGV